MPRDWQSDVGAGAVRPNTSQGLYDPTNIVKQIFFQEQLDQRLIGTLRRPDHLNA